MRQVTTKGLTSPQDNDILGYLKAIWVFQAEQKGLLEGYGKRLDGIDEHLKRHDECLKPLQISWCAGRAVIMAIGSSWFVRLATLGLLALGAGNLVKTLKDMGIL